MMLRVQLATLFPASATRAVLAAVAAAALSGCAGLSEPGGERAEGPAQGVSEQEASGPGAAQQDGSAPEAVAQLLARALPPLPGDRTVSSTAESEVNGKDTFDRTTNAVDNGLALDLLSGLNSLAWGIWRLNPPLVSVASLEVVMSVPAGGEVYLALSDYEAGAWSFDGPLSAGKVLTLDDARHRSPEGNLYLAAIAYGGAQPTMHKLVLTVDDGWVIVTVDTDQVGWHTSLAVVNGNPAISYHDFGNGDLKYAASATPTGASSADWSTYVVEASEGVVGQYTSLAVVEGRPAISYYDAVKGDLKYARSTSSLEAWNKVTVDKDEEGGYLGSYTSLAVVYGGPLITYYDSANTRLKYARSLTPTGVDEDDWLTSIVDNEGEVGRYTSLAVVEGVAAVSYYYQSESDLRYKWFSNPAKVTVASGGLVGTHNSLAVVDGKPAISYYDSSDLRLMYAYSDTAQGTSAGDWHSVLVDNAGEVGKASSLAVIDGRPAIAYHDEGLLNLKFAWAATAAGSDTADWEVITVDRGENVGTNASLAEVDGKPAISYLDAIGGHLMYAIRLGP